MAYVISDDCIACGACAAECPCEAISEGDGKYVIDADACAGCGSCASVCPVGAPQEAYARAVIETFCQRTGKTMIYVTHYPQELPSCVTLHKELTRCQ